MNLPVGIDRIVGQGRDAVRVERIIETRAHLGWVKGRVSMGDPGGGAGCRMRVSLPVQNLNV